MKIIRSRRDLSPRLPSGTRQKPGLKLLILLAFSAVLPTSGQTTDLTQRSLEDLMNMDVTSVSKKAQKTSQTAAAIFVISTEDIRRSGALNIPDLLRMVPGLDVAQISSDKWAISARGFNGQYSNKLLVLIDGRTVYTTIFAGVFWDSQNVPLDSIDRIEVIRGPGAAVWGANAVNGVINIITRSAKEMQGGSVVASGGDNSAVGPIAMRYGGKAPRIGAYRLYAEGFHSNSVLVPGLPEDQGDWRLLHGGFRSDTALSTTNSLMTEAEFYHGNGGELVDTPVSVEPPRDGALDLRDRYSGGNLVARYTHAPSAQSETSLQVYFDRTTRTDTTYGVGVNTFDVDFHNRLPWGSRQDIVWGLGYRVTADSALSTLRISFTPAARTMQLFSSFAQDQIALSDRLSLSLGARLEHNDYTGFDIQPSARLVWAPDSTSMVWAAVSGADRTPARSDRDIRVNYLALPGPDGVPTLISLFGNSNQRNEHLDAFEAGYRHTWTSRLSFDSSAYYNRYHDLVSEEPGAPAMETTPAPVHLLIPMQFGNGLYGEAHGAEVFGNWKVFDAWTLSPGYAFITMHLHPWIGSQDRSTEPSTSGGVPDHQGELRSTVALPWRLQWNSSAWFVNRLPATAVPSYTRLDSGLTWSAGERGSIGVVGQNLLRSAHPEFNGPDVTSEPGSIRRTMYVKLSWAF
jgi:iron complex outermembrane receptor protein